MNCELCGKEGTLVKAIIESAEFSVCQNCVKHGKVLQEKTIKQKITYTATEEPEQIIIPNYAKLIREAREKQGLTQKEFATTLNEKESTIHKLETKTITPSIELAQKLEKKLGITLIETYMEAKKETKNKDKKSEGLTIGDMITIKKH